MSKIIVYFTLLGHNRDIAQEIAEKDKIEVLEFAPGSIFRGYQFFLGKKKLAKKTKRASIEIQNYKELIICGPIWGRKTAPAVNALLKHVDMKEKLVSCYYTYTQDYGNTEDITRSYIQENLGEVKEIKFKNIAKKSLNNKN